MSGDGLVNAAMIPQIKPESATEAAKGLRDMGKGVKTKVTDLNTDWKALRSCYEAPEQEAVYTLQDPAQHSAEDLATTLDKAAGHLDTYAAELSGLKQKFADLTSEITSFRSRVSGGVEVSCGFLWLDTKTVPWYEDDDTLTDNAHLVGRVNELVAELSKAETTCASQIRALVQVRNSCPVPFSSVTKEQLNAQQDLPWGYAREYEPKNCPESVGYGVKDFVYGLGTGVGSLVLGYDPTTGEYFQGDAYAQSWGGLGNLAGSLAVTSAGSFFLAPALQAAGVDNGFTQWLNERNMVVATAVAGLVNIDLNAEDPFARWKDDPWRAGTSGVLNVASFFVPGAGAAGGGLKAGSAGARVARITATIADFAVPGGSYAVKAITSIVRFDGVGAVVDDAARIAAKPSAVGTTAGAVDAATAVTRPRLPAPDVRMPSADDFGSVGPQGGMPGATVRPADLADLPSGPPRAPTGSVVDPVSTPGHAGPSAPPRTVDPIPATDPARSPELVGVGAKPSSGQVTVEAPAPTRGGEVPGSGRPLGDPSARVGDPAPTSPRPAGTDTPPAGNGHPATGGPVDPAPTAGTRPGGTDTPSAGNGHPATGGPADPPPAHPADPPASGDPHPTGADDTGGAHPDGSVPVDPVAPHTDPDPVDPSHPDPSPAHAGISPEDQARINAYQQLIDNGVEPWKQRMYEGNIFDLENSHRYTVNQLHVTQRGSSFYNVVDSLDLSVGEIIERKNTQLANVKPETRNGYLSQLVNQYPPRDSAVTIADTPTNRADLVAAGLDPADYIGMPLDGRQVLEVPVQEAPPPADFLERAQDRRVLVRDVQGTEWGLSADGRMIIETRIDGTTLSHPAAGDVTP